MIDKKGITVEDLRAVYNRVMKFKYPMLENLLKNKEEKMKVNIEIAKIAHQANRDYCIKNQLVTPPKWDDLPEDIQTSIVAGVELVVSSPKITPGMLHQSWVDYKVKEGWKLGKEKDFDRKIHPNLVPYKKLPKVEQEKDRLFLRIVRGQIKSN